MSEDINKHLLSQFYGFRGDDSERKFLSSSKGIESFENLTDVECLSTEHLISSEETGKNQYTEEESEKVYDENNEGSLSKSPHVLTIEDLLKENEKTLESEDLNSEPEIIDDPKDDKNVPTKNFTRLEDTFTKAMAKASETPVQGDMNSSMTSLNMSFTASPVTKAKRLWRQKTILARENVITSPNLLEKFSGTHLNLNNAGICVFPVDILQQLTCLQMLYLDSNNLVELPDEIFTTLKNLKWLDVRNNHLVIIPSCVKGHASLETLLLQGNNIEKLPLELGLVPNLKNLQVAHNPLTFPPKEILDLDCSRIINFLRTMWNVEHPNETIQLRKLSDHKIEKKPSTIICYQPRPLIKLVKSSRYSMLAPKTSKTSVRSKTLNYKPSSRYGSRKSSWALKRIDNNIETNLDNSIVICQFCAASLYRKGVFVENEICNDDCKQKVHKSIKKYQPQNFRETKVYSPESMTESNFLHLLGPSPRSLFIRKNLDFLVTAKRKNVKLCQIEPVDFNLRDYKKIKMKNITPLQKANAKDRIFDVITNDRVKLKIKPMQLKEPEVMFNFLRAYLGITTERSHVKAKKKR